MLHHIYVVIHCSQGIILASTPRELAYKTLLTAEKDNSRYIDDLLSDALNHSTLLPREKSWVMEVVYGVTRMKLQLDAWIQAAYKGRYRKAQHSVKVLLRLGTFQLKHMQTSEHAAIHETVELCKRVKQAQVGNLVNAVLRKIQTLDMEQVLTTIDDPEKRFSHETSHPEWMLNAWLSRYNKESVIALCNHNNTPPQSWIRRNVLQVTQTEFEEFLSRDHIQFQQSELLENFYEVDHAGHLLNSREFGDGWFSFQDLAAGLIAYILDPKAGETIVDACAAPGGKMAFISELTGGQTSICACDASKFRLAKVYQNIERLGLQGIEVIQLDASIDRLPDADRILLDVPCSGTGVLGRRPDARWKRQANDSESLVEIQSNILMNSWQSLRPGGQLVYATCTLEPEENWGVIDQVLANMPDARIEAIKDEKLKPYIDERGALATLPWIHGMDGMFAVKIRKTK